VAASKNARDIFLNALDRAPADRAAYLDEACGDDAAVRLRVEALLRADDESGAFLGVVKPGTDDRATGTFGHAEGIDADPTADHISKDERAGAVIASKYTLVEPIGKGGMGSVWRAKQTEPVKRFVAVKLIKAGMDSRQVLARFEAERQALALMDHPNISKVLDGGLHEGRPYFVMELVKGVPITDYCDKCKLTPKERLELFVPVCQAIQHAHQKGIIHRDIKPSNVLIALYDDRPVVKVIDFGIAKATGGALTEQTIDTGFGGVVGTPQYMSPEQATLNNLDIDTRSDVYSLGVLLYELLTGSPPFSRKELEKKGLLEILRVVREEEPPRPSTKLSTADALPTLSANRGTEPKKLTGLLRNELDWIVMKALEKNRTRRYETANGFATDVLRYLAGEAVQAHPPSAAYRLKKFVRRNRPQVLAANLVLLALVLGIIGTSVGLVQANAATRKERDANIAAQAARTAAEDAAKAEEEAKIKAQKAAVKEEAARFEAQKAAVKEKEANERTQRRLRQIENGVEQFAGLLTGINPRNEEQGGSTVYQQLRERAENAADALDADAVGDPLVVARLQTIYGATLGELGNAAKAVEVLEKARVTRERELGPDHPDTLITFNSLALAYRTTGRTTKAIELFEQVRPAFVRKLGPDHPDTLTTLTNLATTYVVAGKTTQAIELLEQVRDARMKKLGPDHPDTLTTLNNLAGAYRAAGRTTQAIELLEQVRPAFVKKFGPDHPDTLNTLTGLAVVYQADGKTTQAIELLKQVRDVHLKKLGPDHPDTLTTLNNLAAAYWSANRLDESIPLFEELLPRREKTHGRDHPNTLVTVANLGVNYKDAGRFKEALPLLEEAYRASKKYPTLSWVCAPLLEAYLKAGKAAEATQRLVELLPDIRKQFPLDSPQLATILAQFGLALLQANVFAEAEPLLRECFATRQKTQPDAWTTFNTQSMLGGALLGLKKYAEAETLLLAGYEGMKQREKTLPEQGKIRIPEALDRLIELSTATNKPDEVKKWQAERAKYPFIAPMPRQKK
jgi:serine/threonine protein kinase